MYPNGSIAISSDPCPCCLTLRRIFVNKQQRKRRTDVGFDSQNYLQRGLAGWLSDCGE
jgi:hypothetical protein